MISPSAKRVAIQSWALADNCLFNVVPSCYYNTDVSPSPCKRRHFRDYFVAHLPSSSLHTDQRSDPRPSLHKLPRSASVPHTGETTHPPALVQAPLTRDMTVVRIPLRRAKHHFGATSVRGTRPGNEDAYQAGTIDIPAFAKRPPASLTIRRSEPGDPQPENQVAESARGDPQVFYFGVFDGHGGSECSSFLKERLHEYIQDAAAEFELQSSLPKHGVGEPSREMFSIVRNWNRERILELESDLVRRWRSLVGGYFRRFIPTHFSHYASSRTSRSEAERASEVTIEEVIEYAFLRADLDFITAQATKSYDAVKADQPLNQDDVLYGPSHLGSLKIGGPKVFKGGSTASIVMISTPSPIPFWHPTTPSSLFVSHVGDTKILLCSTATGQAIPLTSDHHPSSPVEASRLRRYATAFITDSFGEERMSGLANTRAFGDINSKRMGVSAEPEIQRVEMGAGEYSFLVLMSDGISGTLPDQEIVDIVKEARTAEEGAANVVSFATEVSKEGDNATCLVVRLAGWERRLEGGLGSMGTKESREWRRLDATDPRRSRT